MTCKKRNGTLAGMIILIKRNKPQGLKWAAVMVAPGDTADKSMGRLQRLKVSWLDIVFNAPQSDNNLSDYQFKEDSPMTNVVLLLSSGQLYLVPFI